MTTDDDQPDQEIDAVDEPDEPPEETRDETPEERLDALGADIERVRQQADDPIEQEDPQFIEKGDQEPVDDTIAPPG